jgi:hypothetical protein
METNISTNLFDRPELAHVPPRSVYHEPWFWAAVAVALLAALWIQWPYLLDPYAVEEDARNLYWWNRLQEPGLFVDDPLFAGHVRDIRLASMTLVVTTLSPGYSLLFQVASLVLAPVLFSKLLIFPILAGCVFFLYHIGRRISGPGTSFALCLLVFIVNPLGIFLTPAATGLQRSFMVLFLLALLNYLMMGSFRRAALVIFLSGIIYGPAFVLGAATYGLLLLKPAATSWRRVVEWQNVPPLLVAAGLVALLIAPAVANQPQARGTDDVGEVATTLLSDPKFQEGGRRQLFFQFPLAGRGGLSANGAQARILVLLAIAGLVTWVVNPKSLVAFPKELKTLFFASFVCYGLAWAIALAVGTFPLHVPSRYTMYSVPLFSLIYVVVNAEETLRLAAMWIQKQRGRVFLLLIPVALLGAIVGLLAPEAATGLQDVFIFRHRRPLLLSLSAILLLLGLWSAVGSRNRPTAEALPLTPRRSRRLDAAFGLLLLVPVLWHIATFKANSVVSWVTIEERQLYDYLQALPEDVLIGGDPQYLGGVPLFAKRAILFSEERPHPDGTVMMDGLQAYYAASETEIVTFCRRHGVDYLLVDTQDFTPQHIARGAYLFEPYNSRLQADLANQTRFALAEVPDEMREFQAGWIYLVACERLAETAATP